ncbi:hypothetical protein DPMN_084187 [Dreissena polymorpha]|uniref:Uncharacterized protein n=1 Tax=Dreissena polymorpha TaxID=45954 RepID=A0A9D4BBT5_DREPO|nr:hypothetical protein DPMN_084187 [Dreissena polymorpha]
MPYRTDSEAYREPSPGEAVSGSNLTMFVGPAKTRQFKPVELYIPGSKQPVTARDESTKRLYREEPEMWRIFRRLYEVPDLGVIKPDTVTMPDWYYTRIIMKSSHL